MIGFRFFSLRVRVVRGRAAGLHRAGLPQRAPELDPALIQQLRERCAEQARQLQRLQAQFNRTSLCLDVFSITTQHFCHKVKVLRLLISCLHLSPQCHFLHLHKSDELD